MITKFKASHVFHPFIETVSVDKETSSFIWLSGQKKKISKSNEWCSFHDSWDEAHNAMIFRQKTKIDGYRRSLEVANARLGNIKGMKKP